jgi:SHS2 domain-containing protein
MQPGFEVFDHGADIGVRGWGSTVEEAFIQGAKAMFSLMTEDLQSVKCRAQIQIQTSGYDLESMFVAWLNVLLTESDLHGLLLAEFEVHIHEDYVLTGQARGEPFGVRKEERGVEVKGATFCQVAVYEYNEKWVAQCVVDV